MNKFSLAFITYSMMEVIAMKASSIDHFLDIDLTHCHQFVHFQYSDTKFHLQRPIYRKFDEFR